MELRQTSFGTDKYLTNWKGLNKEKLLYQVTVCVRERAPDLSAAQYYQQ